MNEAPQTMLATLQQCSENDKKGFLQLAKVEQTLTVQKSLEAGELIQTLAKDNKLAVITQIIRIIEYFQELVNVSKKMENFQIQVLAGDLLDRFGGDTLEDIILMFKMARRGEFGQIYRLDGMVVMDFVEKYLDFKAQERERLYRKEKDLLLYGEKKEQKQEGRFFHELPQEIQEKFKKMSEEKQVAKYDEPKTLADRLPREQNPNFSLTAYLEALPEHCKKMSKKDLATQIISTQYSCPEAHEILIKERERRKTEKKAKKNDKNDV